MKRRTCLLFTLVILGICGNWAISQNPPPQDPPKNKVEEPDDTTADDLKILRGANEKTDGPGLLEFFRKRTFKQPDPKYLNELVQNLGDDDFDTREKAFIILRDMGSSAMAAIKQGENSTDLEVRKRSLDLRQRIENKVEHILQAAAARMLGRLKPEGTAEVLMAFLPFATETIVVDDVSRSLGAVAVRNGKAEPILVKALEDPIAVKRGAAGEALVRGGVKAEIPNVKKLLQDKDISVRFRVCMAMLSLADKDVLPVMIDLLADLPASQLWPVEEALHRLAGEKAPTVSQGTDDTSRRLYRDAWRKWLSENEKTIDMAKLVQDDIFLNYTLIVQQTNVIAPGRGLVGEVFELNPKRVFAGKSRSRPIPPTLKC